MPIRREGSSCEDSRTGRRGKPYHRRHSRQMEQAIRLQHPRRPDTLCPAARASASLTQREVKTDLTQQEVDRRFFAVVTDLAGSPSDLVASDGRVPWRGRSTACSRPPSPTGQEVPPFHAFDVSLSSAIKKYESRLALCIWIPR